MLIITIVPIVAILTAIIVFSGAMELIPLAVLIVIILPLSFREFKQKEQRLSVIQSFEFPDKVFQEVKNQHPHLSSAQLKQVEIGLREYFKAVLHGKSKMVSMPSLIVDEAWHQFILFTRDYKDFCSLAFGRFIHHTPAEAMESVTIAQKGIKTAWNISCKLAGINPASPSHLPILFAIDKELNIANGYYYNIDCLSCKEVQAQNYCAGHIGSGCGGCGSSGCGGCGGCGGG